MKSLIKNLELMHQLYYLNKRENVKKRKKKNVKKKKTKDEKKEKEWYLDILIHKYQDTNTN